MIQKLIINHLLSVFCQLSSARRHLKKVIKPSGRVVIIERHADLASGCGKEHAWQSGLLGQQAEQAGWILLQCELIPGSDHLIAVFVKPEAFAEKLSR